jgi:hypothetical protein
LFATVLIQRGLDRVVESAPVVFIDCNESEWLEGAGNRTEHFCCAEHHASLRPEHQLNSRTLIERAGQAKQAAGNGNDLQFAMHLVSAREAKNSCSTP